MKNFTLIFFSITTMLYKPVAVKAQVNVSDSLALVDLYNSTDGPHWTNNTNWLTKKRISTWYGTYLSGNSVSSLALTHNNLSGTIPASLGNVTNLTELQLNNNNLTGSIPGELSKLKSLEFLILDHNQLSGSIPSSFGRLKVQYLHLNNNLLSGNIPGELANNKKLEGLYLQYNQLSGSMPAALADKITLLQYIDLSNNKLSGNLPAGLKNINLGNLYLNNNEFTGTIPLWDSLNSLRELNLSHNQLTGNIPNTLAKQRWLTVINLSDNQLRGDIPKNFSQLHYLERLNLKNNFFQGSVPSFLTRADVIEIQNNHFTFDGLEMLAKAGLNRFKYSPQKKIDINQNGNILYVYAGGTLSNNTYKWYKNKKLLATKTGDSTFTPTAAGTYTVEVTNSVATELTLYSDAITYSTLIANQQTNISSLQATDKNVFSVYPNPAHDFINVYLNSNTTNAVINVYDINGKKLITQKTTLQKANNISINVASLVSGTYYVETIINEKIFRQKFIKQ